MASEAVDSAGVTLIRRTVPEFEDVFQEEFREEGSELGAFQTMSVLADWISRRLQADQHDEVARRVFDAVERLITDDSIEFGDALAAEFIEATWDDSHAVELMGPKTRERATPRG